MKIRKIHLLPIVALMIAMLAVGCKTNEANYRQAYETAKEGMKNKNAIDSTIYSRIRNNAQTTNLIVGNDTLGVRTEHIAIPQDGGMTRERLKRYNVVVGQFKQIFNARQMRERLQNSGYADAFIINTAEPLYYVCTQTCTTADEAVHELEKVKNDKSIVLREPLPFLLRPAHIAPSK